MNVFELFAKLGLDTSEYDKGLQGAEKSASNFGANLKKGIGVAAGVSAAAITATTAATVAGTKAFVSGVSDVAKYGDNIEKTSQKLGIGVEKFQEWDYVMNIAGTSMNNMTIGMKTMTNQLDNAKNGSKDAIAKFQALGLSLDDIQNMSREEVFEAAIYGFQGMAESTERAALANDLFGRSGQELTPLFNMTQDETKQLIRTANDYGMVMSEDAVNASATFQDSLTTMQNTMTGMKNNMLSQFLPSFSTVMDGLSLVFSGDSGSGLDMVESGVNSMADTMSKVVPQFIKVGGTILTALAGSITENLPTLLKSGAEAISQIGSGIIKNLPSIIPAAFSVIETIGGALLDNADEILNAGVQILLTLTQGIASKSEKIVPTIVSLIHTVVSTLTKPEVSVPLIRGGLQIITGLAMGLAEATPELVGMIPEIIGNLILTLQEVWPDIAEAVLSLLASLGMSIIGSIGGLMGMSFDEIAQGFSDIFDAASQFGKDVLSWFTSIFDKNLLGDVSSFFTNLWKDFSGGFNDVFGVVTSFGDDVWKSITGVFTNVKTTVSEAVSKLIQMLKFDWSLPKLKLPHFKVSGGEAPWGFGGKGSLPSVKISWYKKALNDPYFLDSATIFGAAGGKLLGGGESGSEVIVGTNRLMQMMQKAVGASSRPITIIVNGAEGQDVRELAKAVAKEFQNLINDEESVYA